MLPGIRAVTVAIIAAFALLIGAFALAAMMRVAQESRSGQLRADLAQRGRALVAAIVEPRTIAPLERPAPLEPSPVAPVEVKEALEIPPAAAPAPTPEAPVMEPPSQA